MGVEPRLPTTEEQRAELGAAREPDRSSLRSEQKGEHQRERVSVRKVADEKPDQEGDHETDHHAQQSTQQVRQRGAREPKVDPAPPAQQVRRAEVREDQTFERGQPDDRPARVGVGAQAPDHEITEQETTDHPEPRPCPSGEILGTLHGLPPQETERPASLMNAPDLMGEGNAAERASARVRTSTTSRPEGRPAREPAGINARVRPCRAASWRRRSRWPTRRTSPDNPSSPITSRPSGIGLFFSLLMIDRASPRSAAGSVIRMPPATLTKTSDLAKET